MAVIDDMAGLATIVVGAGVVQKITEGVFPSPNTNTKSSKKAKKTRKTSSKGLPGNFSNIGF